MMGGGGAAGEQQAEVDGSGGASGIFRPSDGGGQWGRRQRWSSRLSTSSSVSLVQLELKLSSGSNRWAWLGTAAGWSAGDRIQSYSGSSVSANTSTPRTDLQWALGKAGEDRVHVVVSKEHGWMFVGIYDGLNGLDAPEFLMDSFT
ncbi:hypothetical protein L1987_60480 [Smallanthus sonchifolius]|uniref:Uncharacterized protein n=1 Tax=Smallanthus sonchifolius TaxID=185202 RepID=A0ACB9D866_9ASTR|nr:hypothetical protein L1987_60480 [Smallanthus sonchifolius]